MPDPLDVYGTQQPSGGREHDADLQSVRGSPDAGRMGELWLGTENQNLPAYVVLRDPAGYNSSGKMAWSSGWLPALYQGVEFSSSGTPIHHLNPAIPLPPVHNVTISISWPS
jgi:hypothetical protein